MKEKLKKKFWVTLVIFSLMGQIAWVVENMYFNVFIYKMFHASAANISLMVGASAVTATLTTLLIGALSDKIGKRKIFICLGYILWGISILAFTLIRMDLLEGLAGSTVMAASLGVTLVIIMDCVMTFFGSSANDACFNAWLTDIGDETNRGRIEGINSMMPLVAILAVFGGFMPFNLDLPSSWTMIYMIIGLAVILIGIAGFWLIEDRVVVSEDNHSYWKNVLYSFRLHVIHENKLLYCIVGAFAVFGISIQIFMPYLILYYEKTLKLDNYVLIMAPAIILAAVITAFYGKLYDLLGFETAVVPTVIMLMGGYLFLFFCTNIVLVFIGSLLMMTGYLTGMAMFGAMIRDHIPEEKTGLFQGLRIFGQVFVPGIIGPAIGALVLRNAEQIVNNDGTTSFLPNRNIYLAALIASVILMIVLYLIFRMIHTGHRELPMNYTKQENDEYEKSMHESGTYENGTHENGTYENDTQQNDLSMTSWKDTYPRPQLRRDSFFSLDGNWILNNHEIEVPFVPQSVLSGYRHHVGMRLNYEKTFILPKDFDGDRIILHFGAVDQIAEVTLNDKLLGRHEGGYLPFSFDVTGEVKRDGDNLLKVRVTDTLSHRYPYGKQRQKRGGMWYTPISGIWQSVWMESVPDEYVQNIKITPDMNGAKLVITRNTTTQQGLKIRFLDEPALMFESDSDSIYLDLAEKKLANGDIFKPHRWQPEDPYLYRIEITVGQDCIQTYFALRTIEIVKVDGRKRVLLNGKPIFLHAALDQGYYSDGIFLPKTPAGYYQDIMNMKELGLNTLRKHIKIEPECFYYYCDQLGMLVMQDMVNSGDYHFIGDTALPTLGKRKKNDLRGGGSRARKEFFVKHMKETAAHLYNHPSIVYYTIFNEGWGQFESDRMYGIMRECDKTRIIDTTSGWFRGKKSDVMSVHIYFKTPPLRKYYNPLIVSECGGYSYTIPEHSYSLYAKFGYGNCADPTNLTDTITAMYEKMILPAIEKGLAGCVYTQLSDVEDETNGFYTYDRMICKVEKDRMLEIREKIDLEMAKLES